MPFGYKWFSRYQNGQLKDFLIYVEDENIGLLFTESNERFQSVQECIKYEKKEDSTFVSAPGKRKEIEVEERMIDAFCEDYRMFLINHNTISDCLKLRDKSFKTYTNNRIFECMKSALESKEEKFKVKSILFEMFDQKQVIELLQFINPEILTEGQFSLSHFEDLIDYLIQWNRGCRLKVSFHCVDLSTAKLESFKRMFNYPSVFRCIQSHYGKINDSEKEMLIAFFEPFKPKFEWKYITFELEDPSIVDNLAEQADRLGLKKIRSLEVLANPLLMERIAEGIDYFDILRLRKASRDIRSCIDALKLDPQIAGYEIRIWRPLERDQSRNGTELDEEPSKNTHHLKYRF
uniref:FTH domain-containing protein n=1 Tax=Caenorhabditis tropicalis TaxID=1561998 RepID=A0A1I7UDX7_9PELO